MTEGNLIFEAKNVNKNFKLNSSFESALTRFLVGKKTKMVKNKFWDMKFTPLFNVEEACKFNGVIPDTTYKWYYRNK